jgi:DNA-binding transcriptional ArsR family regulator
MSLVRGQEAEMLEALLGSEKKEKILLFLFTHGEAYPREVARTFQFHLNTVQNQLLKLEQDGVVYSRRRGKVRLFGLSPRYAFKKELETLLEKALGFIPQEEVARFYRPRLRPRRTGKPL